MQLNIKNLYFAGLTAAACLGSIPAANASIVLTLEAPGVSSTSVSGATTETFDEYTAGQATPLSSSIGEYTSGGKVISFDQYGGANETGNYLAVGAQSGGQDVTLTLNSKANYFGMWYTAGDDQNELSFYNNGAIVGSMSTKTLLDAINNNPNYFGKPGTGQDAAQPFAYINFYGTDGTTFDSIVFHNDSLGSGFESDNHSIFNGNVPQTGTPVPGGVVPEPAAPLTFAFGAIALGALMLRSRSRRTVLGA